MSTERQVNAAEYMEAEGELRGGHCSSVRKTSILDAKEKNDKYLLGISRYS